MQASNNHREELLPSTEPAVSEMSRYPSRSISPCLAVVPEDPTEDQDIDMDIDLTDEALTAEWRQHQQELVDAVREQSSAENKHNIVKTVWICPECDSRIASEALDTRPARPLNPRKRSKHFKYRFWDAAPVPRGSKKKEGMEKEVLFTE